MRALLTRRQFLRLLFCSLLALAPVPRAGAATPRIYVLLWFDTEDYLLPASDDAALRLAEFLSKEKIRATFKVVGEKARTLERRGRADVIAALKKHEIGYHSNFHSVEPTPAVYLSEMGWEEGVAEFDRRERPGYEDVKRIFGVTPTCYGQPGSSWAPQSYGAMRNWGMPVYLDSGGHAGIDGRPCFYCGILNLYKLEHRMRANLASRDLSAAEDQFVAARRKLVAEGGGVVSIMYHPCEFVHKQFWDGVNFRDGANPPRADWRLPPMKTPAESRLAFEVFENYVRFLKRFPDVRFITASEAATLYEDQARKDRSGKRLIGLKEVAQRVGTSINFQKHDGFTLAASEAFWLLNGAIADYSLIPHVPSTKLSPRPIERTPFGPSGASPRLTNSVTTDWSQFCRTAADVQDYLAKHDRIPSAVWLGSVAVPPEAYLRALAQVTLDLLKGKPPPEKVVIEPARLAAADYVAEDAPELWRWVIFPRGFHAPALMTLAKRQAWTLKPALLHPPLD